MGTLTQLSSSHPITAETKRELFPGPRYVAPQREWEYRRGMEEAQPEEGGRETGGEYSTLTYSVCFLFCFGVFFMYFSCCVDMQERNQTCTYSSHEPGLRAEIAE